MCTRLPAVHAPGLPTINYLNIISNIILWRTKVYVLPLWRSMELNLPSYHNFNSINEAWHQFSCQTWLSLSLRHSRWSEVEPIKRSKTSATGQINDEWIRMSYWTIIVYACVGPNKLAEWQMRNMKYDVNILIYGNYHDGMLPIDHSASLSCPTKA